MKIEKFERDEENKVWAFEGDKKVLLDDQFIVEVKPQVGDEINVDNEPDPIIETVVESIIDPVIE